MLVLRFIFPWARGIGKIIMPPMVEAENANAVLIKPVDLGNILSDRKGVLEPDEYRDLSIMMQTFDVARAQRQTDPGWVGRDKILDEAKLFVRLRPGRSNAR